MQRCLIPLAVVILLWAALLVEESESAAMFDQDSPHFKAQQKSCSKLCGFCPSCNGFYCGEECICECRQDPNEHVQCINKIKENSDKMGLIYDVLIQMPQSSKRLARSPSPGYNMHPDDAATFRKVLEWIRLPLQFSQVPLRGGKKFRYPPLKEQH